MKKGFTLMELIAIIVILGLIVVLAVPTIINIIKNSKEKLYETQIKFIEDCARSWAIDNINALSEEVPVFLELSELLSEGYLNQLTLNDPRTNEDMNGCILIDYNESYNRYEYTYNEKECSALNQLYADNTGASIPELTTGMIPVVYDGTNWVKANIYQKWYDYDDKEWANAVTVTSANREEYLNAGPGKVIPISDINTMWVWIPRYKYAIPTGSGARSINIVFESKDATKSTGNAIGISYRTHPAFSFGATEVSGIWVGKFETTGGILSPTILPNNVSIKTSAQLNIKQMYDSSIAMKNNETYGFGSKGDIHMMKNSEWGAVVYLSHSKYGINEEIYKNNSSLYTGRSGGNISGWQSKVIFGYVQNEFNDSGFYTYDGKCAMAPLPGQLTLPIDFNCTVIGSDMNNKSLAYKASTTGTIYGVYDLSGGASEVVMGMYSPPFIDISGFGTELPDNKYLDKYNGFNVDTACSGWICYGHALSETYGWYTVPPLFVNQNNPWLIRGIDHTTSNSTGSFYYSYNTIGLYAYRLVQSIP